MNFKQAQQDLAHSWETIKKVGETALDTEINVERIMEGRGNSKISSQVSSQVIPDNQYARSSYQTPKISDIPVLNDPIDPRSGGIKSFYVSGRNIICNGVRGQLLGIEPFSEKNKSFGFKIH